MDIELGQLTNGLIKSWLRCLVHQKEAMGIIVFKSVTLDLQLVKVNFNNSYLNPVFAIFKLPQSYLHRKDSGLTSKHIESSVMVANQQISYQILDRGHHLCAVAEYIHSFLGRNALLAIVLQENYSLLLMQKLLPQKSEANTTPYAPQCEGAKFSRPFLSVQNLIMAFFSSKPMTEHCLSYEKEIKMP